MAKGRSFCFHIFLPILRRHENVMMTSRKTQFTTKKLSELEFGANTTVDMWDGAFWNISVHAHILALTGLLLATLHSGDNRPRFTHTPQSNADHYLVVISIYSIIQTRGWGWCYPTVWLVYQLFTFRGQCRGLCVVQLCAKCKEWIVDIQEASIKVKGRLNCCPIPCI